jgi:hypothetical protein
MQKQTCFKRKFNSTSNDKKISSPNFCTILKKSHQFIFSLQYKKKSMREKKKNWKYLKRKKLKEKKLVAGVLGTSMLCVIHCATVENTEDSDDWNTFRAFNPS